MNAGSLLFPASQVKQTDLFKRLPIPVLSGTTLIPPEKSEPGARQIFSSTFGERWRRSRGCHSRLTFSMNRSPASSEEVYFRRGGCSACCKRTMRRRPADSSPPLCSRAIHGSRPSSPNNASQVSRSGSLLPGNFVVPSSRLTRDALPRQRDREGARCTVDFLPSISIVGGTLERIDRYTAGRGGIDGERRLLPNDRRRDEIRLSLDDSFRLDSGALSSSGRATRAPHCIRNGGQRSELKGGQWTRG